MKESFQGKGCAQMLLDTAFEKLISVGESKTFVLTNSLLTESVALYKKNHFVVISEEQHPIYIRCNLVMEKRL